MTEELKTHLDSLGWFLKDKGLIDLQNSQLTHDDVIKELLNKDLRRISRGVFENDFSNIKSISGPLVLQLASVINLLTPLQDQREKPRLLQLTLTDGVKKIKGVEIFGNVENVSLNTPPGTKFMVKNPITIQENILFLGPRLLENLGGEVEELIKEWNVQKFLKVNGNKKSDKRNGPPPFTPFKIEETNHRQSSIPPSENIVEGNSHHNNNNNNADIVSINDYENDKSSVFSHHRNQNQRGRGRNSRDRGDYRAIDNDNGDGNKNGVKEDRGSNDGKINNYYNDQRNDNYYSQRGRGGGGRGGGRGRGRGGRRGRNNYANSQK